MNLFKYQFSSFAAMLLFAGSGVIAQTNNTIAEQDKVKQLEAQYVSTFVSQQEYELPWAQIKERDIAFKKRVWRDIDTLEKENKIFNDGRRNATLMQVITEGVLAGDIKIYDAGNDRFTQELSKEEIIALFGPEMNGVTAFPNEAIKYQIKEDWLYMLKENKMVMRTVGMAAVKEIKDADGKITDQPLFWIYYPHCRNYLAQHKVKEGENSEETNWDRVLEDRKFVSKVIKVSSSGDPIVYKK